MLVFSDFLALGSGCGNALTIRPDEIGNNQSGWSIEGAIHEDYYEWVNDFTAVHADLGIVQGNFEDQVWATSQEAYDHFIQHHAPQSWDYGDI